MSTVAAVAFFLWVLCFILAFTTKPRPHHGVEVIIYNPDDGYDQPPVMADDH